jgi:hypothetical protein
MKLKKFNEMFDPMGTWNPKQLDNQSEPKEETSVTEEEIKEELKKRLKDLYHNVNLDYDNRIEQLLKIHQTWLRRVLSTSNAINNLDSIVDSIIKYEKNINNQYHGNGPFD